MSGLALFYGQHTVIVRRDYRVAATVCLVLPSVIVGFLPGNTAFYAPAAIHALSDGGTCRFAHAVGMGNCSIKGHMDKMTEFADMGHDIAFGLLSKVLRAVVRKREHGLTFHQYIAYEGMRDYQSGLKAVDIQNLLPSTSKTCQRFARKHATSIRTIKLPDGTNVPWLGRRDASRVLVLLHGGGYMAPALPSHLSFAFGFLEPADGDVSVVVLPYALSSENANQYPRQLQQAAYLIEHLVQLEKVLPSVITLIGDSAGAHLLLSLILHIANQNPLVSPLELEGKFAGAVLLSPWVAMASIAESMQSNQEKDILSAGALEYWAQNFMGDAAPDPWNTPLIAPDEWWSQIPVHDIAVIYGDDELLRDDTARLCQKLQGKHPRVTVLKFVNEIHVNMVMNHFLCIKSKCESKRAFIEWMENHLKI